MDLTVYIIYIKIQNSIINRLRIKKCFTKIFFIYKKDFSIIDISKKVNQY